MSFLMLANVPFDETQENAEAVSGVQSRSTKFIFFDDPARLLTAVTPERMEIIRLLREEGPMTMESISASVAREKISVMRDLESLLDLEIIDLDRDASYLFGFDGMRITCQYPHPGITGRTS
jgi:predicted transcriptional regulator